MGIRVLLVDDHPTMLEALSSVLAAAGIKHIAAATTCHEAMRLIDSEFDVVLVDVMLPDGNGFDLLRRIKNIFPALPVLMHSLHDSPHFLSCSFHLGASGYLIKGNDKNILLDALRQSAAGGSAWTDEQLARIRETNAEHGQYDFAHHPGNQIPSKQTV